MSRLYRREPECLHCDDSYFVPAPAQEIEPGQPSDMTPCVCRTPDPDPVAVTDETVRADIGYAS